MTFSQWWNTDTGRLLPAEDKMQYEEAYTKGAENAYPALATVCAERNALQVENLKLRKALKEVAELFEVQNANN